MNDVIKLDNISKAELIKIFNSKTDYKSEVTDKVLQEIIDYVNDQCIDEYIEKIVEMPNMPNGVMGMLLPKTKYFINMKTTTLTTIGILIDFVLASNFIPPVGTGILTITGAIKKGIHKINDKEIKIIKAIINLKREKSCPPSAQEIFFEVQKSVQSLKISQVEKILDSLEEKEIINKRDNRYAISF